MKWSQEIKANLTIRANYIARKRLCLINKERREMWERWREEARQEARKEFPKLLKDPLFIAGIMLYWGEGDSKIENSQVRLSNTDSHMLRLFTRFLIKIGNVPNERIRAFMILYPDLDEDECRHFWSHKIGIPRQQFTRSQFIQGRHPTRRLDHGVCQIQFCSRQLKEKIFVWIDLFQKQYPTC